MKVFTDTVKIILFIGPTCSSSGKFEYFTWMTISIVILRWYTSHVNGCRSQSSNRVCSCVHWFFFTCINWVGLGFIWFPDLISNSCNKKGNIKTLSVWRNNNLRFITLKVKLFFQTYLCIQFWMLLLENSCWQPILIEIGHFHLLWG